MSVQQIADSAGADILLAKRLVELCPLTHTLCPIAAAEGKDGPLHARLAPVLELTFRSLNGLLGTVFRSFTVFTLQLPEAKPGHFIVRLAPVLELTFRSLNGLLERFHHSYFLYVLLSPDRFVTVEAYLVPVVALLLALALQVLRHAIKLTSLVPKSHTSQNIVFELLSLDGLLHDSGCLPGDCGGIATATFSTIGAAPSLHCLTSHGHSNCSMQLARWRASLAGGSMSELTPHYCILCVL